MNPGPFSQYLVTKGPSIINVMHTCPHNPAPERHSGRCPSEAYFANADMTPTTPQGPIHDAVHVCMIHSIYPHLLTDRQTASNQRIGGILDFQVSSGISLGHRWEEIGTLDPFSVPFGHLGLPFLVYSVLMEGPASASGIISSKLGQPLLLEES